MNLLINLFFMLLWRLLGTPPLPTAGPSPLPTPTDTPLPAPGPIPGGILDFLAGNWPVLALVAALVALAGLLWYSVGARRALLDLYGMAHQAAGHLLADRPITEAEAGAIIGALFDEGDLFVPVWLRVVFPKALIVPALVRLLLDLQAQVVTPAPPSPTPAPAPSP